jgi:hypothetical protein
MNFLEIAAVFGVYMIITGVCLLLSECVVSWSSYTLRNIRADTTILSVSGIVVLFIGMTLVAFAGTTIFIGWLIVGGLV